MEDWKRIFSPKTPLPLHVFYILIWCIIIFGFLESGSESEEESGSGSEEDEEDHSKSESEASTKTGIYFSMGFPMVDWQTIEGISITPSLTILQKLDSSTGQVVYLGLKTDYLL